MQEYFEYFHLCWVVDLLIKTTTLQSTVFHSFIIWLVDKNIKSKILSLMFKIDFFFPVKNIVLPHFCRKSREPFWPADHSSSVREQGEVSPDIWIWKSRSRRPSPPACPPSRISRLQRRPSGRNEFENQNQLSRKACWKDTIQHLETS